MEIIGRISKGSKMDQIYIPKNRSGMPIGNYVSIKPINIDISIEYTPNKLVFYNLFELEQIKVRIIEEIFNLFSKNMLGFSNIIITGSFLDSGFNFNDVDILVISEEKFKPDKLKQLIKKTIGINPHIIILTSRELLGGISYDPLYEMMLSRYVSLNKIIYNKKRKMNYQLLDINLLKSKQLMDNFDLLNGKEKYYLIKNMISIFLFIKGKKLSNEVVDKKIEEIFGIKIDKLKDNIIERSKFTRRYKEIYNKTQNIILNKNGAE